MTFQYLVFGFETGGKKKVCHIQGYVYFNNALSQSSVKKKLPRAHLEVTKGTPDQNFDYTSKDGDFYEFGEKPLSGRACFDKIERSDEKILLIIFIYIINTGKHIMSTRIV